MINVNLDLTKNDGAFKIMHAVNNGPCHKRHTNDQLHSNFADYKAARIPYARNHDASYCSTYGGEHSVDISAIFPNFDADPYDEASYDFVCTDEYVLVTLDAGTETYYRLGQKIEHYVKKFGTLPPKDFKKWAVICEHIIRHYNEGWAAGFKLNIQYWEIWNEPDLDPDDSLDKRTWGGTTAEFFDLFEITAKHLKSCFPHLKIGGPAVASVSTPWVENFLCEMKRRGVPMDFFSWHIYNCKVSAIVDLANTMRGLLEKSGYGDAESILNEWNYVKGWVEEFTYSIKQIIGYKGAAFTMATMSACQYAPVDMLMYYDARPCGFNGLFDIYTMEKLKGYYPFLWYSYLYDCEYSVRAECDDEDIYTLLGVNSDGSIVATVTYYTDDDNAPSKDVKINMANPPECEIYLVDFEHNGELVARTRDLSFTMKANSIILIKEKK